MEIINKFDLTDKTINLLVVMARTGLEFKHTEKLCKGVAGFIHQDYALTLAGYISDKLISLNSVIGNYFTTSDATEEFINWYNTQIIAYKYLHRRPRPKPLPMEMRPVYILKPPTQGFSTYGLNPAYKTLKEVMQHYDTTAKSRVIYR